MRIVVYGIFLIMGNAGRIYHQQFVLDLDQRNQDGFSGRLVKLLVQNRNSNRNKTYKKNNHSGYSNLNASSRLLYKLLTMQLNKL